LHHIHPLNEFTGIFVNLSHRERVSGPFAIDGGVDFDQGPVFRLDQIPVVIMPGFKVSYDRASESRSTFGDGNVWPISALSVL
jgi:hypothetical protein